MQQRSGYGYRRKKTYKYSYGEGDREPFDDARSEIISKPVEYCACD